MDEINSKSNLKALEEILLDQQRLVTYLNVSKEFCVHVNEAKLLLSKVVEDIKTKQPNVELNVNYLISGLSEANKSQTIVCSEIDLDHIKGSLQVVYFLHIYSLSKGPTSLDKVALLATNKLEDLSLCTGLIKSQSCRKRTLDEIGASKLDSQVATNILDTNKLQQNKHKPHKLIQNEDNMNICQDNKNDFEVKTETPLPKKTSTMNKVLNKNDGKTTKSIAGFFNKVNTANKTKEKRNKEEVIEANSIKKEIEGKLEKTDVDYVKIENKNNTHYQNKPTKKSVSDIKKDAKVDKKRKRLLHISDSESDSERNDPFADGTPVNNESEDEIPPTPSANTIKITSGIVNPKKRRKIVDKTYVDDEGYFLTRKEEVYESCSENEETNKRENVENKIQIKVEISPKEMKSKNKKKTLSPQKGKQPTMMNFFKKI